MKLVRSAILSLFVAFSLPLGVSVLENQAPAPLAEIVEVEAVDRATLNRSTASGVAGLNLWKLIKEVVAIAVHEVQEWVESVESCVDMPPGACAR